MSILLNRLNATIEDKEITAQESIDLQQSFLRIEKNFKEKKSINYSDFQILCGMSEGYFNNPVYTVDPTLPIAFA